MTDEDATGRPNPPWQREPSPAKDTAVGALTKAPQQTKDENIQSLANGLRRSLHRDKLRRESQGSADS